MILGGGLLWAAAGLIIDASSLDVPFTIAPYDSNAWGGFTVTGGITAGSYPSNEHHSVDEICRVIPVGTASVEVTGFSAIALDQLTKRGVVGLTNMNTGIGGNTLVGQYSNRLASGASATNWAARGWSNAVVATSNGMLFATATNGVMMLGDVTSPPADDPFLVNCQLCTAFPWWVNPMDLKVSRVWPRFSWWYKHLLIYGLCAWIVVALFMLVKDVVENLETRRQAVSGGTSFLGIHANIWFAQVAAFCISAIIIVFPIVAFQSFWNTPALLAAVLNFIGSNPVSIDTAANAVTAGALEPSFYAEAFTTGRMVFDDLVPWRELLVIVWAWAIFRGEVWIMERLACHFILHIT